MATLQGKFRPTHPEKYRGDAGNILYRSSWEYEFMKWCDQREEVIWWQSEERRIPYYDPVTKKRRVYFPDFYLSRKCHDGIIRETLVEVKPQRQIKGPPVNPKRRTRSWMNEVRTYITNQAKWAAAEEWCEDHGSNFQLLSEKQIKTWNRF